jgi:hypothetical protein
MTDYVKATNFFVKDSLLVGNPDKIVKGSEIDTEFNNIATAVSSKANYASPNLTGLPTAPTAAAGTNTSQLATTAFVKSAVDANNASVAITGGTIDDVDITGGTIVDLDTPLAVNSGGTGKNTLALNNVLLGNGTAAVKEVAPGASGNVLKSDGTTWVSGAADTGISTSIGSAPYYGARAWAKISGSTVNGSGNIASVSNSSAGVYDFTFTTAMPDNNYAIVATNFWRNAAWAEYCSVIAQSTSGFSIRVTDGGDVNPKNVPSVYVVVYR